MTSNVILRPAVMDKDRGKAVREGALEMSRGIIGSELRFGPVFVTVPRGAQGRRAPDKCTPRNGTWPWPLLHRAIS